MNFELGAEADNLRSQLHDDWNGPGTVDSQTLGLTLEKGARR